uniref:Putative capsid morphogenesis protein n=1 Tax=viral metagenome TaxID=1070528 RepID=A0A6M3KEV0_9ZZZZ
MPDAIDKTAELFAKQAEQIRTRLITELAAVYKKGGDPAAFAEQMLKANFSEHIIRDMGFGADMDSLFAEYDKIAGDVAKTFGAVSQVAVEQLKTLDSLFFMEHVRDVGEALTRQMVYAVYTGITEKALIENLLNATKKLSEAQIGSLTNTALRTFGRGTFAATAAEYAPADAKFVYVGPSDDKTRPICQEILAAGAMTRAEISARFGDAFISGGQFNCRHSWQLVTEET